jgi:integrase
MAARKKRRSSGTGSIFKDKYGYFNAQICVGYRPDGKPNIVRKRSKVESEVVAWLKAQTVNQAQGITIASDKLTVEQYLTRWLDTIARSNRYTTHKGYAQICRDHIYPRIGRIQLARLSATQVQSIINTLDDAGRARNTIRNVKACLRVALSDVRKQYPIAYEAVRSAKLPKIRVDDVAPRIQALTPEQARLFLAVVESERLKALYWVALLLGLRQGELLGLRIEDLDLDAQALRISGAIQPQTGKGLVRVPTKTKASAVVLPLPNVLIPILHEHLEILAQERTYARWQDHGLLFPTSKGTPISARNLVRRFKTILETHELPDIRFHDLRHTTATLLITLGVHPRVVMEILRHTQIATTMNLYAHALPDINRTAVNALGELMMPERVEMRAATPS